MGTVQAQTQGPDSIAAGSTRLNGIQASIDESLTVRTEIRSQIENADPSELVDLQEALEQQNKEIRRLRESFEQVAVGAVDLSVLGEIDTSFDWQEEVKEVLQPIVQNLKALTDKPRKIGRLQTVIEQNQLQRETITQALLSIDRNIENATAVETRQSLVELRKIWNRKLSDNAQELDIAKLQLTELQTSNVSWVQAVREAMGAFFRGRGLTLLIAVGMAVFVWLLMRGLLRLFQYRTKRSNQHDYRTRRRLAQYAYRALTLLLIFVAIISVFYSRGDMLLMGLSILASVGLALGLRQAIPRFISEMRLLLNLGSIRENERVIYRGLPWQVVTLNVHSVFRNPELTGVVRLPLGELASMVSRPVGQEAWFPASKGDYIILDDRRVMEVLRMTPDQVELKDGGGTIMSVPTVDFYAWTFRNLSRGQTFGVASEFGIDYRHQDISLTEVPARFQSAIRDALARQVDDDVVKSILVELKAAGASSLDYLVYVTFDSSAARSYMKFDRLIQQTCVAVCTEEGWGIPFPHLTIEQV